MHVSPARQELYAAIERFEQQRKDEMMSRLPHKHGYHASETIDVEPVEWSVAQVGYLKEISVTYKTGNSQLVTIHRQVPPNHVENTVEALLDTKSITYPD